MSESIENVLRDVRKKGKYNKENSDIDWTTEEVGDLMLSLADRFEAAAKALEADRDNWRRQALDEDARKARAALEKPPRNCDVYKTKAERQSAFINWHNETFDLKDSKYAIDTCDLKHNIDDILHEYIDWLFPS